MIVYLQGRLGNQMFEVAAASHYAKKNDMDLFVRESDVIKLPGFDSNPPNCYNRYHEMILGRFNVFPNDTPFSAVEIKENQHQDFIQIPDNIGSDIYMNGIWQSSQYFPDYDQARSLFKMPDDVKTRLCNEFDFQNSVGISIRRGDYLKFKSDVVIPLASWYVDVCKKHFSGKKFIVSSDSIEWCKQQFTLPETRFIDFGAEKNMWALSLCKDHVLSNSTFSWWTGFLNEQHDSRVIYPDKFWVKPNLFFRDNFFQSNWIKEHIDDEQYEK